MLVRVERHHEHLDQGTRRVHQAAPLLANPVLASGMRDLVDAVLDDIRPRPFTNTPAGDSVNAE
jgi:hypothetical protein